VSFENSATIESIFGRWPSFHDAEVLRVVLDRSGDEGPTLEAAIHVFEMTSDVDPRGYYVLKNHTEVTLRFTDVVLTRLQWFNNQNVLSSLEISDIDPNQHDGKRFRVELPSSYGLEAEFDCKRAIVVEVRPYRPREEPAV
jgi:Immunity protein 50